MTKPTAAAAPPATLLTPFTYQVFRAIWIAGLVSNVGTWMQNVAGVWLVTTLTTSALVVALMQAATSLPAFLLSMPAGALADLVDRRRLLLFTQGFMAVVAMGLGLLALSGNISALGVLGFTFLLGMGAALNAPIWQTVTNELAGRRAAAAAAAARRCPPRRCVLRRGQPYAHYCLLRGYLGRAPAPAPPLHPRRPDRGGPRTQLPPRAGRAARHASNVELAIPLQTLEGQR